MTPNRQLPFGSLKPDAVLSGILKGLVDAGELAASVKAGLLHLKESQKFQAARKARSLQEQLRPLFCPADQVQRLQRLRSPLAAVAQDFYDNNMFGGVDLIGRLALVGKRAARPVRRVRT